MAHFIILWKMILLLIKATETADNEIEYEQSIIQSSFTGIYDLRNECNSSMFWENIEKNPNVPFGNRESRLLDYEEEDMEENFDTSQRRRGDLSFGDRLTALFDYEEIDKTNVLQKILTQSESKRKAVEYTVLEFWGYLTRQIHTVVCEISDHLLMATETITESRSVISSLINHFLNMCTDLIMEYLYDFEFKIMEFFQKFHESNLSNIYQFGMIFVRSCGKIKNILPNRETIIFYAKAMGAFLANGSIQFLRCFTYNYFNELCAWIQQFIEPDFYFFGLLSHIIYSISSCGCEWVIDIQMNSIAFIREKGLSFFWETALSIPESTFVRQTYWSHIRNRFFQFSLLRYALSVGFHFFVMLILRYAFRILRNWIADIFEDHIESPLRFKFSYESLVYTIIMHFMRKYLERILDNFYTIELAIEALIKREESSEILAIKDINVLKKLKLMAATKKFWLSNIALHFFEGIIFSLTGTWRKFIYNIQDNVQSTFVSIYAFDSILYRAWMYFFDKYTEKSLELLDDTVYQVKDLSSAESHINMINEKTYTN